ncbi:MFS general substrate transporter [Pyrenochaeta sp. DS3sAY3a]|nr:MFS general substrate transporter [Pyrenochaeta sp. DS3sAY3a]
MNEILRDAPFGQFARYLTNNRVFLYPEEKPGFQCPDVYFTGHQSESTEHEKQDHEAEPTEPAPSRAQSSQASSEDGQLKGSATPGGQTGGQASAEDVVVKVKDGVVLVDWYTTSDAENPQNWSQAKKAWVAFLITLYTFVIYAGSSIYVPSTLLVMEKFGVGHFKASLGLALYVLGYGCGPMLWAPMSEVPQFGRNLPYISSFAIFILLTIPTALVDNLGGLLTLRFLLGFFGSPCLANGGATLGDMYSVLYLPYSLALWIGSCFAAPALGPLFSAYTVYAKSWRWSQWEILLMSAPILPLFLLLLPETNPTTILHRRTLRLRTLTSNASLHTSSSLLHAHTSFASTLASAAIKPLEIGVKDPALFFVNLYTALTYAVYYSYFEAFPLVYPYVYGFTVLETSVVFVSIVVGFLVALGVYYAYLAWYLVPDIKERGMRAQEHRLVPAVFASVGMPVGLFIFGWTAKESVHWMVPTLGIGIYACTCFVLFQCIINYVPMSYPQYAASLFAGNDFCRSLFAFGAVLFGRPMYVNLGISKGTTVLAGLNIAGIFGITAIWYYGAKLRAKSKFAV